MENVCQPCRANQQNNTYVNQEIPNIILPNQTQDCTTTLTQLNYLVNLIDLNIASVLTQDKFLLQVYKGQIQSGINIGNYCYTNYVVVEKNIFNVLSRYK